MNRQRLVAITVVIVLLMVSTGLTFAQEPGPEPESQFLAPLGTGLTYQGRLEDGDGPINGACDLAFELYDAPGGGNPPSGGAQLGAVNRPDTPIVDGYFTVKLDFGGSVFAGEARWLQVSVDCGEGATTLAPRQELTASPYALYANSAGAVPWSGLSGVPTDLADGDQDALGELSCSAGRIAKWNGTVWECAQDDDTTYTGGTGLELSGSVFSLHSTYRLPQTCTNGQIAEWNGSAWVCGTDDVGTGGGGGDITAVFAGTGLTGGGESGDVSLGVDETYLQRRVGDECPPGSSIRSVAQDGSVVCETDDDSGGDVTGITAGTGLTGGGESGDVSLGVDETYLQRRVGAECPPGSSIRSVAQEGTVVCEPDDDSGGDITSVTAGTGLTGGGMVGDLTLEVEFAGSGVDGTAARSDHDHDGLYAQAGHDHDTRYYTQTELQNGTADVHWDALTNVPEGLQDGDDNTTYSAGAGLNLIGNAFSADFAGTGSASSIARSDHQHDAVYINDNAGEVGNADVPVGVLSPDRVSGTAWTGSNDGAGSGLDADRLDGQHASAFAGASHDHLGQTWTGSNNPLKIEGSFGSPNYAPLELSNTTGNGLNVISTSGAGLQVSDAGGAGVSVGSSAGDGLFVSRAGAVGCSFWIATNNGVEIGCVEDAGLRLYSSGSHGVLLASTGDDGVHVSDPQDDGIQIGEFNDPYLSANYGMYIPSPGTNYTSVWVQTADTNGEWAFLTSDKISAANVTASTLTLVAQADGPNTLMRGDLVAVSGVTEPLLNSREPVPLVRLADSQSWSGVIGVVESRMEMQPAPGKESDGAMVLHSVPGPARAGDYVALTVLGVAQLKVDAAGLEITPGQRLTASDLAGHARALRTETLNGMLVTEGAPVIGIALAAPTSGSGTIPVFVTLR